MSWYLYLNREQLYQRNYRSHNLWLNFYNQKMRQPKIAPFHIALFKRVAKSYSGVSNLLQTTTALIYKLFLTFRANRLVLRLCSGVSLSSASESPWPTSPLRLQTTHFREKDTTDSSLSSPRTSTVTTLDSWATSNSSWTLCLMRSSSTTPPFTTMTQWLPSKFQIWSKVLLETSPPLMFNLFSTTNLMPTTSLSRLCSGQIALELTIQRISFHATKSCQRNNELRKNKSGVLL